MDIEHQTSNLKLTIKAWPVIAAATIGLCFLTQQVAKLFGIELPDQANIDIVRRYAGWNRTFAFLCLQIIILLPALEELYFRHFIYRRSSVALTKQSLLYALIPTLTFFVIGYVGWRSQMIRAQMPPETTVTAFFAILSVGLAIEYPVRVFLGRALAKTSDWSIAITSAVFFSAAHYIAQPWPDAAFLALFFFGLAQCWLYRRTDRLWCAMLNHALFNLTNLILLFVV